MGTCVDKFSQGLVPEQELGTLSLALVPTHHPGQQMGGYFQAYSCTSMVAEPGLGRWTMGPGSYEIYQNPGSHPPPPVWSNGQATSPHCH